MSQNVLSFNKIVGFFAHQYFWKETTNALDFLLRHSNQGKVAYKTTTTGWV